MSIDPIRDEPSRRIDLSHKDLFYNRHTEIHQHLQDIERAKKISAISDYIVKPIGLGRLKHIIEELLEERKN